MSNLPVGTIVHYVAYGQCRAAIVTDSYANGEVTLMVFNNPLFPDMQNHPMLKRHHPPHSTVKEEYCWHRMEECNG